MSTGDEIRDLMARYPSNPKRTRAAIDAALSGKAAPTEAELIAARILAEYGFTAEDIEQGLAEGGTIEVTVYDREDSGDDRWFGDRS